MFVDFLQLYSHVYVGKGIRIYEDSIYHISRGFGWGPDSSLRLEYEV